MSMIYLVRHGQASFGKANYDVLSDVGIKQSGILARYFIKTGVTFDAVYSGSMDRQLRTAEIIINEFALSGISLPELDVMPEFNEYDSKSIITALAPELIEEDPAIKSSFDKIFTDRKAFQKIFERSMLKWVSKGDACEGIESWNSVKTRVSLAVSRITSVYGGGKTILIVASGGTISACIEDVTGIGDEAAQHLCWQIANTSVSKLVYNEERITLRTFNAWPHLEDGYREMITFR
ncbi:MAG TPA: histidine phosphatase family protein [Desulfomonilia bacterium]